MDIPLIEIGSLPADPVAADALLGIKRQQTNPKRWNEPIWGEFAAELDSAGVEIIEQKFVTGTFATDAGGTAYGMPHGVVIAKDATQISTLLSGI